MSVRPRWLEQLGLPFYEDERTVLVFADSRKAFEAVAGLLQTLKARHERLKFLLSSGELPLLPWLTQRFPDCRVIAPPFPVAPVVGEYLHRSDVRLAVFVGGSRAASESVLAGLKRRAVPVVIVDTEGAAGWQPSLELRRAAERRLTLETSSGVAAAEQRFAELLARDLKQHRSGERKRPGLGDLLLHATRDPRWRHWLAWRFERLDDLGRLAEALGQPKTILCLGNGPSSEDPSLAGMAHDALFRVNHGWLERNYLSEPDAVFAGGRPSFKAVRRAIFGLQSEDAGARMIGARIADPRLGPTRFFNARELAPALDEFEWGHFRPTNGATMLATAVALRPRKLIVAGVDLFQHPDGTYPGDSATPNAYAPAHTRESELAFLFALFDGYGGELVIVGDILRQAWARHLEEIGR